MITLICILGLTVFVAATVGYIGYLAFGNSVKGVILYSLPNDDPAAITAKICYVLTIMGSFVILIQPIFYVMESSGWYKKTSTCCADDGPEEMMAPKAAEGKPEGGEGKPGDGEKPEGEGAEGGEGEAGGANNDVNMSKEESVVLDGRPPSFCGYVVYFLFRTLVVVIVCFFAFLIPNISILITFAGAVLGTLVNVLLPVLFYNRAFNNSGKNRALRKKEEGMGGAGAPEEAQGENDGANNEGGGAEGKEKEEEATDDSDPRMCIKVTSWIVLFFGVVVGIWGLVYVIVELTSGSAEEDKAD